MDIQKLKEIEAALLKMEDNADGGNLQLEKILHLFSFFFECITENRNVAFASLFSRMVYASVHFNYNRTLTGLNHYFRRLSEKREDHSFSNRDVEELGKTLLWHNLRHFYKLNIPQAYSILPEFKQNKSQSWEYRRVVRAYIIDISEHQHHGLQLKFIEEFEEQHEQMAYVNNDQFSRQLLKAKQFLELPFSASLIDLRKKESYWEASGIVLEPDFLVGVTSISECFQGNDAHAINAVASKLIPVEANHHLLMGNVVNYIFDELIHKPDTPYDELVKQVFNTTAVSFALMHDEDLRRFLAKLKQHYTHLVRIVSNELPETAMAPDRSFLEPSFYSCEYGLQGRLDLYHFNQDDEQSDIVELKSGKLFRPNSYGLNENHFIQTLLYDLLLESVHEGKVRSNNYILYSYLDEGNLKYAPRVRDRQMNALYLRNDIILSEWILSGDNDAILKSLLSYLDPEKIPEGFNFLIRDARHFKSVYDALTDLEKLYYRKFVSFINREYHLSKKGQHGLYTNNGLASLWLDTIDNKKEKFMILSDMLIESNEAAKDNPTISLKFSEKSSRLSRFRKGDIAVLYPETNSYRAVLRHQIFKCTIIDITQEGLTVRLRARQKNHDPFRKYKFWHIESDSLDSGFLKQFHGLFGFISSSPDFRRLLLGLEAPGKKEVNLQRYENSILSPYQSEVINKAIAAEDYFLLWGPPGTGKTSIMLRCFLDHYFNNSDYNILLLAYTNKAVDEICASIDKLLEGRYIRLGSRYSCSEKFTDKLLSARMEGIHTREEVLSLLQSHRVFVSTVSSFQGREEIGKIKNFDLVIIDEASQILEPMLVGMLARFEKFILIGDHKQLPAVVVQDSALCVVADEELSDRTGLRNLSNSLFERLYARCCAMNWDWAYAALDRQGRMHKDILAFVSPQFYEGKLDIIDGIARLSSELSLKDFDRLSQILIQNRMIFVDTPLDETLTHKTNETEADLVSIIIDHWTKIYDYNNKPLTPGSIGIITPFRSQIAVIRNRLGSRLTQDLSIDTVERYQGGARDHILISLAVSKAQALESISNVSSEGIDRKLNVALTRARENVIIFGTKELLVKNRIYKDLIEHCYNLTHLEILRSLE